MSEPLVIDLPGGESIEVNENEWTQVAAANWNRSEDDGYVQWTQTVRRHADGRTLVYVLHLPTSGIMQTVGEILPKGSSDVPAVVKRLAEQCDVPSNVSNSCLEAYKRSLRRT